MNPGPFFYIWIHNLPQTLFSTFSISKHHFPHYTSIICFQQASEIDNLTVSWGKVFWLCCVQVPRQLGIVDTFVALVSYWFDNLGFITEGKLAATLIIPSSWGLPTSVCVMCYHEPSIYQYMASEHKYRKVKHKSHTLMWLIYDVYLWSYAIRLIDGGSVMAVSYTHLTLPTILLV